MVFVVIFHIITAFMSIYMISDLGHSLHNKIQEAMEGYRGGFYTSHRVDLIQTIVRFRR